MKKNITKELVSVYREQTRKYFERDLMDRECVVCVYVPSYITYANTGDKDQLACSDCPLGVVGNFISCIEHPTFIKEHKRVGAPEKYLIARGNYMIKKGIKAGIDMSGIRK